ncbi:hypothetical protein OGAPHI_005527 [Ogataea philodendri]|uniref:Required for respiratory growth protein 7, mitochondrial n=1 Tax=Ogataea philodendri TaxID=1378263 RepID=A0A9P8NYK2_9ASCO|nr:uncharacterized protein OGAPHI_005527 [Ogataea philodendri]KAH3662278.1 hypothetical protein OGAPHI_005527 [Ogataea philodendri]
MSETSDNSSAPAIKEPVSSEPGLRLEIDQPPKTQLSVSEISEKITTELNDALDHLAKTDRDLSRTFDRIEPYSTRVFSSPKFNSFESYLSHAKVAGTSPRSTVFTGSAYEISFADFLSQTLAPSRVIHQGGAHDGGVDLQATLDLNSVTVSPGDASPPNFPASGSTVRLLVQCKCWERAKMDVKTVRELNGTYANYIRQNQNKTQAILMFVTPTGFTRGGLAMFDSSPVPMIFAKFAKPQLRSPSLDPFKVENYEKGKVESFYCNIAAQQLLDGTQWKQYLSIAIRNKVGNGQMVAHQVPGLVTGESLLQHGKQSHGFLAVSVNTIWHFFRSIESKVVELSLHWSQSSHLEKHPFQLLIIQVCAVFEAVLSVLVVFVTQIHHDGSTFINVGDFTLGVHISEGWDSAVWIELQVPVLFAFASGNVDFPHMIVQPEKFQKN